MNTFVTYCCREKRGDSAPLPAIERYRSRRIKSVWRKAGTEKRPMLILSGLLGLIRPETPIRFYDKLLLPEDITPMTGLVAHQLLWFGVDRVEYFTKDIRISVELRPYHDLLAAACQSSQVEMIVVNLPGS